MSVSQQPVLRSWGKNNIPARTAELRARLAARPWPLLFTLAAALLFGLIYTFLVPPWQHYDEPSHFEYAWLLANRGRIPQAGDYDLEMRRAVAGSMLRTGFFKGMGFEPDLTSTTQPAWIGGYSQLGDPPLYYFLASLPLRLFGLGNPYQNIETQLYAARLVSLALLLASIALAYGLVSEITPTGSLLVWLAPLGMALLPGLLDIMTSVNNDALAVFAVTFALWGALRLVRRGFSWVGLSWCLAAGLLCWFTKNTTWVVIPLLFLALLFSLLKKWTWAVIAAGAVLGVAGGLFLLRGGDSAAWHRVTLQDAPTRLETSGQTLQAPLGNAVFQLVAYGAAAPMERIEQRIPMDTAINLRGRNVTVGAWVWASQPAQVNTPVLYVMDSRQSFQQQISIGTTPEFYAFTVKLPENTKNLFLYLLPFANTTEKSLIVYYDGITLVKGKAPVAEAPVFADTNGQQLSWGSRRLTNLVRGASAEYAWPYMEPQINEWIASHNADRGRPSLVLYSLLDWNETGGYYPYAAHYMLQTFWGKFSWGSLNLLGGKPYRLWGILTILGILGVIPALWVRRKQLHWSSIFILGAALAGAWGITLLKGTIYLFSFPYIPPARYAMTVAAPALLLLVAGWRGWVPSQFLNRFDKMYAVAVPLALLLLNVHVFLTLWNQYYV